MQSEALWQWIVHNEPPPNVESLRDRNLTVETAMRRAEERRQLAKSGLAGDDGEDTTTAQQVEADAEVESGKRNKSKLTHLQSPLGVPSSSNKG